MSGYRIPKITSTIHDPKHRSTVFYRLAQHHTNEEIFLGITLLQDPYTSIQTIDDVFNEIRKSIRALAKDMGRTEDDITGELLKTQGENGVLARNRTQVKEDRFGRLKGGAKGRGVARRVLEEVGLLKEEERDAASRGVAKTFDWATGTRSEHRDAESIRERMDLKNILN